MHNVRIGRQRSSMEPDRIKVVVLAALVAVLVFPAEAFILPIILPPNLLWYNGYSTAPVLPAPQNRPPQQPVVGYPPVGLGGLGGGGFSPYGAARPGLPGLPGLAAYG